MPFAERLRVADAFALVDRLLVVEALRPLDFAVALRVPDFDAADFAAPDFAFPDEPDPFAVDRERPVAPVDFLPLALARLGLLELPEPLAVLAFVCAIAVLLKPVMGT